jgi:DNA-binding FrmR family transcriptional regulator
MTTAPAAPRDADRQHAQAPRYTGHKADHLARLSKIEGQVRGISRMVTDDRYCIDVLTQISAASRALQEVALGLLDDHVRGCVTDATRTGPAQGEEKFAELSDTLRRALRL